MGLVLLSLNINFKINQISNLMEYGGMEFDQFPISSYFSGIAFQLIIGILAVVASIFFWKKKVIGWILGLTSWLLYFVLALKPFLHVNDVTTTSIEERPGLFALFIFYFIPLVCICLFFTKSIRNLFNVKPMTFTIAFVLSIFLAIVSLIL